MNNTDQTEHGHDQIVRLPREQALIRMGKQA
jgi:hypothetical protein